MSNRRLLDSSIPAIFDPNVTSLSPKVLKRSRLTSKNLATLFQINSLFFKKISLFFTLFVFRYFCFLFLYFSSHEFLL